MTDQDDHYIPNAHNAHIDTEPFSRELTQVLKAEIADPKARIESVYAHASSWTSDAPIPLADEDLICRYLSPEKFLKFLSDQEIFFPTSAMFSDPWECTFHPDYDNAILKTLSEHGLNAYDWNNFVDSKKSKWNVSCWTLLDKHHDDHLLWSVYAGGPAGIGITIRYGTLREHLESVVKNSAIDGLLHSGRVSYSELKLLPFNKHRIFCSENEIRFAYRRSEPGPEGIDITPIRDHFGIRISPAASHDHYQSAKKIWLKCMGNERIQWPGRS